MIKELPIPINVSPTMKAFIIDMKPKLKKEYKKFYTEIGVLLHYLKQNKTFMKNYSVFCNEDGYTNDLICNDKIINTKKILKYAKKDMLVLLIKNK